MKNIIVTGASRGIGYQTCLAFAEKGHNVLAIARSEDNLNQLKEETRANGRIRICALDISGPYNIGEIVGNFETVDIVINNAGYLINKPFDRITPDEMLKVYQSNVFAPFFLVQKLLPYLNKSAHIINIGSVGGVNGTLKFPGLSIYSSSKAALSCLSECWQAEFSKTDLTFNSLALGSVQTEMLNEAFPGYQAEVSANTMGDYISRFALNEAAVIRGKTLLIGRTNP